MSSMSNGLNYFVQLTESGQTVNLSQISSVSWHEVPAGCGWEESGCVATVSFANSYICIPVEDAQELWDALNFYNTRLDAALGALPQLVNAVTTLVEAQLVGAGFEKYSSPNSPYQEQLTVPPANRSAGDVSAGLAGTSSGYSQPQADKTGSAGSTIRVNTTAGGAAAPNQPVAPRQRHSISQ